MAKFIDPVAGSFVAIDFETADYQPDSACAVGLIRVDGGKITRKVRQFIKPPRDVMVFTHIHGITMDYLEDKPSFKQAWPILTDIFDGVKFLVAHNASFDRGVLRACCDAAGLTEPDFPWVCTVQQARKTLNIRPAKLSNVAAVMGLKLNHHEALSDAEACANIALAARQVLKDRSN
ncbi:MAG: 3'-5' exonuclease [Planctomycetota bacterium]